MALRAGQLNQRGVIEYTVSTQNDTGEPVVVWTPLATVWAKVEDLSGAEQFTAQQDASLVQVRVTIRRLASVTSAMRFRTGQRTLDIEAVLPDLEGPDTSILHCLERKVGA